MCTPGARGRSESGPGSYELCLPVQGGRGGLSRPSRPPSLVLCARSGPFSRYSVLDKVVPGYYQRRHEVSVWPMAKAM